MEIISRKDALAAGLTRYFTGKPCSRGHVAERTKNGDCCECKAASNAEYTKRPEYKAYAAARRATPSYKAYMEAYSQTPQRKSYMASYIQKNEYRAAKASHRRTQAGKSNEAANSAIRRARKRKSVPPWFGELDELVWNEASRLAVLREAATGLRWHADHMIPMASRKATGLHVATNCQVIPAVLNMSKQNRMIFTEPLEWLRAL